MLLEKRLGPAEAFGPVLLVVEPDHVESRHVLEHRHATVPVLVVLAPEPRPGEDRGDSVGPGLRVDERTASTRRVAFEVYTVGIDVVIGEHVLVGEVQ